LMVRFARLDTPDVWVWLFSYILRGSGEGLKV